MDANIPTDGELVGWMLDNRGPLQVSYKWRRNPNIVATFTDDGDGGISILLLYGQMPIGYTAHSTNPIGSVIEHLLPMMNNELNWFIDRFQSLIHELGDRVSNNYILIDAIVRNPEVSEDGAGQC